MKGKMLTGGLALLCALLLASTVGAESECGENHVFGPWKTKRETTCRLEGLDFRYCRNCDHWEKRYIDKLPHDVEAWIVTKEPTCTAKGTKEGTCSACGDLIRRSIDMLPHEYGEMEVVTEPTCTQNGQGRYTCEVCGKHKSAKNQSSAHAGELCAYSSCVKVQAVPASTSTEVCKTPRFRSRGRTLCLFFP